MAASSQTNGAPKWGLVSFIDGRVHVAGLPKDDKTCLVIRYGGLGDAIWASSLFPVLKKQGYKIWVNVTPPNDQVLAHDPHVDGFIIQDRDQVPNGEALVKYWDGLAEHFDKTINLCESVEQSLLVSPGTTLWRLPDHVRHDLCNINYVERVHQWAGVLFDPNPRFFATEFELAQARSIKESLPGPVIHWATTGSAFHKLYPFIAQCMVRLHNKFGASFVLTGAAVDEEWINAIAKSATEFGVPAMSIIKAPGNWTVRQTFTFAQVADLVIGPETGVLNSVAHEDVPKVLLLSHSTVENLTRDWSNTISIEPRCEGYPDHKLHQGDETIDRDPSTGASKLMSSIPPALVCSAAAEFLSHGQTEHSSKGASNVA